MTLPSLLRAHLKNTTRRKPKRARVLRLARPSRRAEVAYRNQLLSLVKQMQHLVAEDILPVLQNAQHDYTPDGFTQDDLSDAFVEAIQAAIERAAYKAIQAVLVRARRWAQRMVDDVEKNNRTALANSIHYAFGIDIGPLLSAQNIRAPLQLAMATNVNLIQSIPQRYFEQLHTSILTSVTQGQRYKELAADIQKLTNTTEKRARLIARDQTAKTHSAIAQARQTALGITEYEWQTSGDERVRNSHTEHDGQKFRWDSPPTETGHPGHDIACRCVALPVIDLTQ